MGTRSYQWQDMEMLHAILQNGCAALASGLQKSTMLQWSTLPDIDASVPELVGIITCQSLTYGA
jgi:hypothetical protein